MVYTVPGLNKPLQLQDLEESRKIYNLLPDDERQPEVLESHIRNIAQIFVRNGADGVLGLHLIHAHFQIPENTALLGVNYDTPGYCRWTRPLANGDIDLNDAHGHVFALGEQGFRAYEYQNGPLPDLSKVSSAFLPELTAYLKEHGLSEILGLQVLDQSSANMFELVLPQSTIMLPGSNLRGCTTTRQTGWKFQGEDGKLRTYKSNEQHAATANGHQVWNEGAPHPRLDTIQDVVKALQINGVLCQPAYG